MSAHHSHFHVRPCLNLSYDPPCPPHTGLPCPPATRKPGKVRKEFRKSGRSQKHANERKCAQKSANASPQKSAKECERAQRIERKKERERAQKLQTTRFETTRVGNSPVSPYPLNLGGAISPPKFWGWSVRRPLFYSVFWGAAP